MRIATCKTGRGVSNSTTGKIYFTIENKRAGRNHQIQYRSHSYVQRTKPAIATTTAARANAGEQPVYADHQNLEQSHRLSNSRHCDIRITAELYPALCF